MADYEMRIETVQGSVFAMGEGAEALGVTAPAGPGYQEIAQLLTGLLDLIAERGDEDENVAEIRGLALAARREAASAQPDKQSIRGLLGSMRRALGHVGAGVVGAGALADAITKIVEAARHL